MFRLSTVWYRLRRIRAHTFFLLFILSLVVYCLQLPDSLAEHPEHPTGHHRGLLVTTPTNLSYPLHYLHIDERRLDAVPVSTEIEAKGRQSVSHLVGHPRLQDLFYVNDEVVPGSIVTVSFGGSRNTSDLSLKLVGQDPSQGDLPAHSLVTRDGQHLIAINVSPAPFTGAVLIVLVWLIDYIILQYRIRRTIEITPDPRSASASVDRIYHTTTPAPYRPTPSRFEDLLCPRLGL